MLEPIIEGKKKTKQNKCDADEVSQLQMRSSGSLTLHNITDRV